MAMNIQSTAPDVPQTPAIRTISLPPVIEDFRDEEILENMVSKSSSDIPPLLFFDFGPFTPMTPCLIHPATSYFSQCQSSLDHHQTTIHTAPTLIFTNSTSSATSDMDASVDEENSALGAEQATLGLFAADRAFHPTIE